MEPLALIRAIRGAPLTVLVALTMSGQPLGTAQLATLTGYSDKTVTSALLTLQGLGLVQRHGRYQAWLPSSQVGPFLGTGRVEPEIPRFADGCGCSRDDQPLDREEPETTTTAEPAGENDGSGTDLERPAHPSAARSGVVDGGSQPPTLHNGDRRLSAEWLELAGVLVERCATPPALAHRTLARARDDGYYPEYIRYAILRWLAYCLSDHGKTIKNRGAFIASRIAQGLEPPDWFSDPHGDLGRDIRRARAAWEAEDG